MSNPPVSNSSQHSSAENETANPREHSEAAAEGPDGLDRPEIRAHSQEAAEGRDDE